MLNLLFNNKFLLFILGFIGLGLSGPLTAAELSWSIEKQSMDCQDKNLSNSEIMDCFHKVEKKWEQQLSEVYTQLKAKLNDKGQKSLAKSQKQWVVYKTTEQKAINAIYEAISGTMWRIVTADSRVKLIKDRVLTLKEYLDNLE